MRGRVARLKNGHIGRFGWKAEIATLREFTLQACANELGLEVPGLHRSPPPWKKEYKAPGIDLTNDQCDALTNFVASLPKPRVRSAESRRQADDIDNGGKLFRGIGCAACHRQNLGDVDGIYSDLLLHDMGRELSDSGAYSVIDPETAASKDKSKPAAEPIRPPSEREWRTPPLWGVGDSAPYLHDGRANTLTDPIKMHGGEGLSAAEAFSKLAERERQQVELFLKSLAAPEGA